MGRERLDILERRVDILQWISENRSKAFMARELFCKPHTLASYLIKMGIDYNGNQSGKGGHDPSYIPAIEYLGTNKGIKGNALKAKLFREEIKECKCEKCGLTEWLNEPAPLELHHKDNNHYNNSLDNLIILCSNCHSIEHTK